MIENRFPRLATEWIHKSRKGKEYLENHEKKELRRLWADGVHKRKEADNGGIAQIW